MIKKGKTEVTKKNTEPPSAKVGGKKVVGYGEITYGLELKKVKEYVGPFKHRVTGKELNSFILETQNALIKMKQDMLTFTNRVNGMGDEITDVDQRHNDVGAEIIHILEQQKKTLRIYQIITLVAVLVAVVSFVLFLMK